MDAGADTTNINGSLQTLPTGNAVPYNITSDGVFTGFFATEFRGATTNGGSFAIGAGDVSNTNNVMLLCTFIRAGSDATTATLNGSYWVVGISSDPSDSHRWTAFSGTAVADGAGNLSYVSTQENYEGVLTPASGSDTYSVSSSGRLVSGGREGAVTQDGQYAYLSGSTVQGEGPLLFLFIRK